MKPILFSLGPFHLFSYGLMIALGVIASLYLMQKENRVRPIGSKETVADLVFITLATGLAGSRIYYVLQNAAWYLEHPLKIFAVWEGGLIFYGGLIAAAPAVAFFFKRKKIPLSKGFDFLIPYGVLAQAFGRIGCFLNGCCAGKFCDLPWAVSFPNGPYPVHPVQLYEAIYLLILFWILTQIRKRQTIPGQIFPMYLVLYGIGRFSIEFFRDGNPVFLFLTYNQWLSLVAVLIGVVSYLKVKKSQMPNLKFQGNNQ